MFAVMFMSAVMLTSSPVMFQNEFMPLDLDRIPDRKKGPKFKHPHTLLFDDELEGYCKEVAAAGKPIADTLREVLRDGFRRLKKSEAS